MSQPVLVGCEPLDLSTVPEWAKSGLKNYLVFGIAPGGGLRAILENDLEKAMARCCQFAGVGAIDVWWIVSYLYNEAPGPAWGNPDKVKAWLDRDWAKARSAVT